MAFLAKTLFPASGYTVDKGDYVPTEVIGQGATTLLGAGYVVEVPDDEEQDKKFFDERGYLLTAPEDYPNEAVPGFPNDPPNDREPGVVPPPYETASSDKPGDEVIGELDERTEGERVVDPNSLSNPEKAEELKAEAEASGAVVSPSGESAAGDDGDVNATDGAKELAEEENVDLSKVEGTGDGGRVTKDDVKKYLDEQ